MLISTHSWIELLVQHILGKPFDPFAVSLRVSVKQQALQSNSKFMELGGRKKVCQREVFERWVSGLRIVQVQMSCTLPCCRCPQYNQLPSRCTDQHFAANSIRPSWCSSTSSGRFCSAKNSLSNSIRPSWCSSTSSGRLCSAKNSLSYRLTADLTHSGQSLSQETAGV